MDVGRLVFIDESGVNSGMTKLYGRAAPGERIVDYVPDVRYERTTILSSMRLNGELVYVTFPGALNGDIFRLYIEKILIPTLHLGDVVVMDSLSSHKVNGIGDMIHRAGAYVLFQPRYSPDFNPVEQLWSKIKTFLRKAKARSADLLHIAISDAFSSVSTDDVSSWFHFTGYSVPFLSST